MIDVNALSGAMPAWVGKTHTGLAEFCRRSLDFSFSPSAQPVTAAGETIRGSSDIWPLPPPSLMKVPASGRRRGRQKRHRTVRTLLSFAVCALNWCTLGHPTSPTMMCHVSALPRLLRCNISRLEALVSEFSRLGPMPGSVLGRCLNKF